MTRKNLKLIKISVSSKSPKRKMGRYYYEDKRQEIKSRLNIRNQNNYTIDNIKVELFVFGKNVQEKKYYTILKSGKASVTLKSKEQKEALVLGLSNVVDKKGYKHGYDYYGYVALIRNPAGKVVKTASNRSKLLKLIDKFNSYKNKEFTTDGVTRRRQFYIDYD